MNNILPHAIYMITTIFFLYFIVLIAYYAFLAVVGFMEERKRRWQNEAEDYPLTYFTSFTLPVSIVIPARNEELWIRDSFLSMLNLNYPEFEIIVVDDNSTDRTLAILDEILDLKPRETQYVKHFKDGLVMEILKSVKYPNVTVITKTGGLKKAGAVNAALNLARYKYVCVVDADTVLERDSLLKVMAYVEKDPEHIIGAGSYFGLSNGFEIKDGTIKKRSFSYSPLIAYQNLEYVRSFFGNRIAWSRFNSMPNVPGGFGIWRRDILYELGGFSPAFTCEDIEITFRAHSYIANKPEREYTILMLPYYVSWTEGPSDVKSLLSQRSRWQRVVNETVWEYKYMLYNPRYKAFAFLTMPYYIIYEVMGVFFEIASILFVLTGWLTGLLDIKIFAAFMCLTILSQTIISLLSLFAFMRSQKVFRITYVAYLILLAMTEMFWYKWIISISKLMGTFDFLRNKRTFDQYTRQKRG
ncbi:MAG: glycosyltransferase [Candidatus Omnitrophica bacterium]|nr:glycosyltransferase [Candidatus Omnitrophota bacterium]MDD5437270.1 glycosyltransferase [Candidatus Omnitrophota bacterium]